MLLNQMGRERALAGMKAFIKSYQGNSDHPVIQDFLASMRPFAADTASFDAFTHQWFLEVVVPEYRLNDPRRAHTASEWEVTAVKVENIGTGLMPVDVAAIRGERFTKDGTPNPDYQRGPRDGRHWAGANQRTLSSLARTSPTAHRRPRCESFQLRRKSAVAKF